MIKSLRLRLQLFHAIILLLAVILFGGAFYRQLHRSTMREIDAGLLNGARGLEGRLRSLPPMLNDEEIMRLPLEMPPAFDSRRPPPFAPNRFEVPPRDQRGQQDRMPPRRGNFGPPSPDFPPSDPERSFPLFPPPYFAIFSDNGRMVRSNTDGFQVTWNPISRPVEYRNVGERREVFVRGPNRLVIVVGRDIAPEMQRLTTNFVQLLLIGSGVVCLGLIGGWWLASNAIRPIEKISQTAASITAQNLSERINTVSMDRELQSLGTTLNSMLSRIQNAFDKQRQFTADASHDLRTPLAVVLSHCELALSRPRSSEEYKASLQICLSAAGRMKSLVDGLLLLARCDAGELELKRTQIDLSDLAEEAITLFEPYAAEHQVELKRNAGPAPCMADSLAMSQVISNLLDNAILYNRSGGQVTLSTSTEAGMAVLQVNDTGPGIRADVLPRIYDRFYRVDEVRLGKDSSTGQTGSGLGLSICKGIVEAHGGSLTVTSELNVGSTFVVRLPS